MCVCLACARVIREDYNSDVAHIRVISCTSSEVIRVGSLIRAITFSMASTDCSVS